VLTAAVEQTHRARRQRIETRHFLLALLARDCPDPAADLLLALSVNREQVRGRLE